MAVLLSYQLSTKHYLLHQYPEVVIRVSRALQPFGRRTGLVAKDAAKRAFGRSLPAPTFSLHWFLSPECLPGTGTPVWAVDAPYLWFKIGKQRAAHQPHCG